MKKIIFIFSLLFGALGCTSQVPGPGISLVDPLKKLLRTDTDFGPESAVTDVARGEVASVQLAVRSNTPIKGLRAVVTELKNGNTSLKNIQVKYVGYVKLAALAKNPAKDVIRAPDMLYPDPLLEQSDINVDANTTQPVWLSIDIPVNTLPGLYSGKIKVTGNTAGGSFTTIKAFSVQVYPVQIKSTRLLVSMTPAIENDRMSNTVNQLTLISNKAKVAPYSAQYWASVQKMAQMMHAYRQNAILVYTLHIIDYTPDSNGNFQFDFSKFDQIIETFQKNGDIKRIIGGWLGGRNGGWYEGFDLFYYYFKDGKAQLGSGKVTNKDVVKFYQQFIPAFMKHLKEKRWDNIYYQHLVDEPIDANAGSYLEIAAFFRQLAPNMKTLESVQTTKVTSAVNIPIPVLDFLDQNYEYYRVQQSQGKELWFYTCWLPQGEYANRFIELPLIKTRLLHWINYKYRLPGYEHWAYNNWSANPLQEAGSLLSNGETLPGGDSWIVYPKQGGFLSSIRLEAMRDGIIDYELLKMLEARKPALSNSLAGQIIKSLKSYETNIQEFRKVRRQLLQAQ
ncbi:DUF4091 domain-containing protein [Chitinophaga flava]|uniref:Uncharacterized protein n=1 Tax=Chitinophaga flava TaxID=2259036 RepID=A0A365Y5E6_9BACT|nr:DUF4091 domain-containing protein [Chitinophaga flava]RBL93816.1 hypothetical protein DF182_15075 [Chitinophaga flava]